MTVHILERYQGSLLGLSAGDALGTTLEFQSPGTFPPIDDIIGGGKYELQPGQWTDDTSMALCLAESLIECQGFNPIDQMQRYLRWFRNGHWSSTGTCFSIGKTTREALLAYEKTGHLYAVSNNPHSAGNGSIMRLAPVPLYYAATPLEALKKCADSSRTTHKAIEAIDACRYLGALIVGALRGVTKEKLLSPFYTPAPESWDIHPLTEKIADIASGSFKRANPPQITGSGYVVQSLESALWAFFHSESFRDGALLAVNLGDDADTTGAVYGQLAGAYYGLSAIPENWRQKISKAAAILNMADKIFSLSPKQ